MVTKEKYNIILKMLASAFYLWKEHDDNRLGVVSIYLPLETTISLFQLRDNNIDTLDLEEILTKMRGTFIKSFLNDTEQERKFRIKISEDFDRYFKLSGLAQTKLYYKEGYGLYFDPTTKKPCYNISGLKRDRIIQILLKQGHQTGKILKTLIPYNRASQLSNEIEDINKNFKKTLALTEKLIIRPPERGYKINPKFNIIIVK